MELDIKTVTGGPLDVNTYVVGASGSNQCVLIDPGAEYASTARSAAERSRRCCSRTRISITCSTPDRG